MSDYDVTQGTEATDWVQLNEPLWWNADRTKIVKKGDPDAAYAYGGASTRVPLKQAEADGLIKSKKSAAKKK